MSWRPHWLVVLLALVLGVAVGGFIWSRSGKTTVAATATTTTISHPTTTALPSSTTTPALSFAQLYAADSSGVIRIDGTSCDGGDVGTGFLVAPDLVLTVAHVVAGTNTIALTANGLTHTGQVIGINTESDLALVQSSSPFPGHIFTLASSSPPVGETIGVIGFPEGGPITLTQGIISGLNRTVPINGISRSGLAFAQGDQASYDSNITIYNEQFNGDGTADFLLTFTSVQESAWGPNGDTCDNWNLDYQMEQVGGTWLINSVTAGDGVSTHTTC
jgi:S1-C subfamily serine protease